MRKIGTSGSLASMPILVEIGTLNIQGLNFKRKLFFRQISVVWLKPHAKYAQFWWHYWILRLQSVMTDFDTSTYYELDTAAICIHMRSCTHSMHKSFNWRPKWILPAYPDTISIRIRPLHDGISYNLQSKIKVGNQMFIIKMWDICILKTSLKSWWTELL